MAVLSGSSANCKLEPANGRCLKSGCAQECRVDGHAERLAMTFTKRLREGVRRGEITCSVRIWTRPHVKVGGRYRMEDGEIEVDSIEPIGLPDITPELARESGFLGVVDLLKIANHGKGSNIYLVRFHYVPPPYNRGIGG